MSPQSNIPTAVPATPVPAFALPAAPILLVDDDEGSLQALDAALDGVGVEVATARSGNEALGALLKREFAVVLLDVRMPGIDGFETARLIRSRPASRHVPIIFITGVEPSSATTSQAYALGAVDFLWKPVSPEALRSKIGVFVELFRRSKEAQVSRARYDALVDFAPVGVFHADARGDGLWANERWRELSGLPLEGVRGRGWVQAIHPDDRERVTRDWFRAVAEGSVFRSEFRFLHANGSVAWVLGQAKAELDTEGRIAGYVGTFTDIGDRKRVEEALEQRARSAREDMSLVVDALPSLISFIDADERYVRVNRGYEAWFGLRRDEIEGRHMREVLGEAAYARLKEHVRAALAGRTVTYDAAMPYRLGGTRHIHAEYVPRRDPQGRVSGFVAFVTDISDTKRAEEALRQSERELADFFENSVIACHWVGPDGTILRANQTELNLLGHVHGEYVGHNIREFHEDKEVIEDLLRRLRQGEVIRDFPARLRRKDGAIREVLIDSSVLWKDGQFVHSRCFTRDVTELRRAQEAQGRLAAIVESSQDAIVSKTLDGIITSWNQGAERVFGYAAEEVVGRSITLLFPEELRAEEEGILARLKSGERIESYETRRRAKDGRILDVSLTISPILDVEGRVIGASKVARDITDRRRRDEEIRADLERRVSERTASLQDTIRELDTFAYTVAHDLRAPLRAIHSFGQLLLEDLGPTLNETGRTYLTQIIQGGGRMDALINDLLKYSRLSREQIQLATLGLEGVVDKVLEDMAPELEERRAAVRVVRPMPRVRGHAGLLAQALTNLVSNAAKFVRPGERPEITIRAERAGERVRIWVEDQGIGIEPRHQGKLFQIFERLHTREAYPGTGIGLAIVRRAAERMGGAAGLESEGGKGARFWLDVGGATE